VTIGRAEGVGRAPNNHEALFDREQPGADKRSSEVRLSRAEVERRTAGENLGGTPSVRIGSVEQQPP
jgi:hypothetical protein